MDESPTYFEVNTRDIIDAVLVVWALRSVSMARDVSDYEYLPFSLPRGVVGGRSCCCLYWQDVWQLQAADVEVPSGE